MKKILAVTLSMIVFVTNLFALSLTAGALGYTTIDMETNGTWYSGYIDANNTQVLYKINLKSDGKLKVVLQHSESITTFVICDENLYAITGKDECYQYEHTDNYEYDLSKGTYVIKVTGTVNRKNEFKINSNFENFNNQDKEPNDDNTTAMRLYPDEVLTGALTYTDRYDWYKISVPCKSKVTVVLNHYMRTYFSFYDSNLDELTDSKMVHIGKEGVSETDKFEYQLKKGVYYIKIGGSYSGKYKLSWKINISGKKPSGVKVSSKKRKTIKASWKQVSGITGYQIQYATNRKFTKGKKTVTVKKAKTTSKTIKKLKSKKKYYVRIRAYKTINGKKYYSSWTKTKSVKTK